MDDRTVAPLPSDTNPDAKTIRKYLQSVPDVKQLIFLASPLLSSLALEEVSTRLQDLERQLKIERARLPESQQNLQADLAKAESEKIVFERQAKQYGALVDELQGHVENLTNRNTTLEAEMKRHHSFGGVKRGGNRRQTFGAVKSKSFSRKNSSRKITKASTAPENKTVAKVARSSGRGFRTPTRSSSSKVRGARSKTQTSTSETAKSIPKKVKKPKPAKTVKTVKTAKPAVKPKRRSNRRSSIRHRPDVAIVVFRPGGVVHQGIEKFRGPVKFSKGRWVGVQCAKPVGRNNGTVKK